MALAPSLTPARMLIPSESPEYLASLPMSFDEYIDWDYEGGLVEWVDGVSEYAAAGVREYWLIESRMPFRGAEFFVLPDGEFVPAPVKDGVYRSEVADGFWFRPEWLWDQAVRSTDALREILDGLPE